MPTVSRLRRHVSFAQVNEGEIKSAEKRRCNRSVMEDLAASGITPEAVAMNSDGCSFIIDSRDEARLASAIHELNVAVKLQDHCARISLTRTAVDWPLPSLSRVMQELDNEGIDVVHLASEPTALTVLVDEGEADHVVGVFFRFCQPAVSKASEPKAS